MIRRLILCCSIFLLQNLSYADTDALSFREILLASDPRALAKTYRSALRLARNSGLSVEESFLISISESKELTALSRAIRERSLHIDLVHPETRSFYKLAWGEFAFVSDRKNSLWSDGGTIFGYGPGIQWTSKKHFRMLLLCSVDRSLVFSAGIDIGAGFIGGVGIGIWAGNGVCLGLSSGITFGAHSSLSFLTNW
jgi:hypothetical protein